MRVFTPEWRARLTDAKLGSKNPNFGKHFSDNHKRKISEALKGRKRAPFSEETRHKMSVTRTGRKYSREHRLGIRVGLIGLNRGPRLK